MKDVELVTIAAAWTVMLLDILSYVLFSEHPSFFILSDVMTVLLSMYATFACFYAFKFHGIRSVQGRALHFLLIGGMSWLAADIIWAVQEIVLELNAPLVSLSDVFYYMGYIFIILGIYTIYKFTRPSVKSGARLVAFLATAVAFGIIIYNILHSLSGDLSLAETLITHLYVIMDFVIIGSGVLILPIVHRNRVAFAWIIVITGFILTAIADIFFAYFADVYETGAFFDLLWHFGYIVIALGYFNYTQAVSALVTGKKER